MTIRINTLMAAAAVVTMAGISTSVPAPAEAAGIKFKRNHIEFDGNKYFVRNSTAVKNGSYGRKRTPAAGQNYLEPQGTPISVNGIVDDTSRGHQFSSQSSTNVQLSAYIKLPAALTRLEIEPEAYYNAIKERKCTFMRSRVSGYDQLKARLNRNNNAIDQLKRSNKGVIVYDLLRVQTCTISTTRQLGASTGTTATAASGASAATDASLSTTRTVNFAHGPDTVIGYRLYKLEWDKRKKSKRTTVVNFRGDSQGIN